LWGQKQQEGAREVPEKGRKDFVLCVVWLCAGVLGGAVYTVNCSISKYDFHIYINICMNHISHLCDVILHDSN